MGANQSVHMANSCGQVIHVAIAMRPEVALTDIYVDCALFAFAIGELKSLASTAADLPAEITTFGDLFKSLLFCVRTIKAWGSAAGRPPDAVYTLIEAFKKTSIRIPYGQAPDISDRGILETYLNADGIAGLLGVKTMSAIVMTDDAQQLAMFDTAPDSSWIATSRGLIVRSKYGSLWQEDPSAGQVEWPRDGGINGNEQMKEHMATSLKESIVVALEWLF
ncbi:hypothetical protein NP233_g10421 [Leucocoprinus birnbaumii]|uniref:Uncharacterized protein n=1 Tax=Leucocoprinus birnbaumii TaxID=56174 RepID=A0AAD5YM67_9AGAR|nr:hypothetical protein NP233_g10421 [Leucocoprinus birnbaumii]